MGFFSFCFIILSLLLPRTCILITILATDWIGEAYVTYIWPMIGFILMPCTTLAYGVAVGGYNGLEEGWFVVFVVAIAIDIFKGIVDLEYYSKSRRPGL